jgi:hypothetical protein
MQNSRAPGHRGDKFCTVRQIYVDTQYGTCFISTFWRLEYLGGAYISLENLFTPGLHYHRS